MEGATLASAMLSLSRVEASLLQLNERVAGIEQRQIASAAVLSEVLAAQSSCVPPRSRLAAAAAVPVESTPHQV